MITRVGGNRLQERGNPTWRGAVVFVCLIAWCAAPASAQSIGSQQATGAELTSTVAADVRADVSMEVSSSSSGSGNYSSGGGRSAATAYSGAIVRSSRSASPSRSRVARHFDAAARSGPAANPRSLLKRARFDRNPQAMRAAIALVKKSIAAGQSPGLAHGAPGELASYSEGFPDSTKGTALISPPDLGTKGPFAFDPQLNFKLPDFSNRQFLVPSLRGGGGQSARNRNDRRGIRNRGQTTNHANSPEEDLGLDVLRGDLRSGFASNPVSDLGADLTTSVASSLNQQ